MYGSEIFITFGEAYTIKKKGFTIVELIMVLVLISITSAQFIPRFFNLTSYQQKVLFDDTLNALRYAQKLAITMRCNVKFSISSNTYTLKQPAVMSNCRSQNSVHFTQAVVHPATGDSFTGNEVGITLSDTTLYFTAEGVVSTDAVIVVGGTDFIAVVSKTGFVFGNSGTSVLTQCANESQICALPAGNNYTVFYGAGNKWTYKGNLSGNISCDNATFGDPFVGTVKMCKY